MFAVSRTKARAAALLRSNCTFRFDKARGVASGLFRRRLVASTETETERDTETSSSPVLLIAGHSATTWDWLRLPSLLAEEGFTSLAWDCRGMGGSRGAVDERGEYVLEDVVGDAIKMIEEIDGGQGGSIDPVHVLGLSWGSHVAQRVAIEHPERIASLTLVGSSPSVPTCSASLLWRKPMLALGLAAHLFFRSPHEGMSREAYVERRTAFIELTSTPVQGPACFSAEDEALVRKAAGEAFDASHHDIGHRGAWKQSQAFDKIDSEELEEHVRQLETALGPDLGDRTLLIHGRRDAIHPVTEAHKLRDLLGCELCEFDGAHFLSAGSQDVWFGALVRHLRRCEGQWPRR